MLLLPWLFGCFKTASVTTSVAPVTSADAFPWGLYDATFADTVDDAGRIDYAAIAADRADLDTFLGHVAAVSPHSHPELFPTPAHALSYWLDAYNALAVRGVLDRPDMASVIDRKVEFFYAQKYRMGREKVSLYTLENGIVRKEFQDPRIHFFLNCQSVSCPVFPKAAVRPDTLDAVLDAATRAFVNDPAHVEVMPDGSVAVSSIFQWYAEDFGGEAGVLPFVRRYNEAIPAQAPIQYKEYDWGLIAQPGWTAPR